MSAIRRRGKLSEGMVTGNLATFPLLGSKNPGNQSLVCARFTLRGSKLLMHEEILISILVPQSLVDIPRSPTI